MLLLRTRNLSVCFDGHNVLDGVNLEVNRGEFLAITGANGEGKTTLLRVILGLLHPTSGEVEYYRDGKRVKSLDFGYLPQKSRIDLKFPISAGNAVKSGMARGWLGRYPKDAAKRMAEVTELCGIGDYLDKNIGVLSGGQLQRTLMARALIGRPEALVLDEPLSYVDKEFEQKIYEILGKLRHRTTIILVSHELSGIRPLADRIADLSRPTLQGRDNFTDSDPVT